MSRLPIDFSHLNDDPLPALLQMAEGNEPALEITRQLLLSHTGGNKSIIAMDDMNIRGNQIVRAFNLSSQILPRLALRIEKRDPQMVFDLNASKVHPDEESAFVSGETEKRLRMTQSGQSHKVTEQGHSALLIIDEIKFVKSSMISGLVQYRIRGRRSDLPDYMEQSFYFECRGVARFLPGNEVLVYSEHEKISNTSQQTIQTVEVFKKNAPELHQRHIPVPARIIGGP